MYEHVIHKIAQQRKHDTTKRSLDPEPTVFLQSVRRLQRDRMSRGVSWPALLSYQTLLLDNNNNERKVKIFMNDNNN